MNVAAEKKKGQVRHSLGLDVGNVPTTDVDETQRTVLRSALYEAPGTTERRAPRGRAKASKPDAPGRSVRAERRAAEKKAEERNAKPRTAEEMFAYLEKELAAKKRGGPKNAMVDQRAKVWQLGSWMNGDKPCPDEAIEWQATGND